MNKNFTRFVLSVWLVIFGTLAASAQTITLSDVDPGPYGPGSSISARIDVSGNCYNPNSATAVVYTLYLSDASGNFTNNGTAIGTFKGFYITFVNGIIPAGTAAGSNYKVRVRSSVGNATSNASAAFQIGTAAGFETKLNSIRVDDSNPDVFGQCENVNQNPQVNYTVTNETTPASATITAKVINETDNTSSNITFTSNARTITAGAAHYTIVAKGTNNGVVSTKSYLLINNRGNLNAFKITEIQPACLPSGLATFNVDLSDGVSSLKKAFPGNVYTVTWGDGKSNLYTLCDIISLNGVLTHTYGSSSCGKSITVGQTKFNNSYGLVIKAANSYCQLSSASIAPVKVLAKALTNFTLDGLASTVQQLNTCLGEVTFSNTSDPGDNPSTTAIECKNTNARYNWYINGNLFAANKKIDDPIKYTFTTPGTYQVKLVLVSSSSCQSDPNDESNVKEKTLCIQNPPKAAFDINGNTAAFTTCGPFKFKPNNTSVTDNSCQVVTTKWTVTGATGYTINGSANDAEPEFTFNNPGVYKLRLTLSSATCEPSFVEIPVTISTQPVAKLKAGPIAICGGDREIAYTDKPEDPFYVELSGTSPELPDTYTWTVTTVSGTGTATLVDPPNTKYPRISFSGPGEYKVTVTHKNDCLPDGVSSSHNIVVQDAPTISATTPDQANCPGYAVPVKAQVTGQYKTYHWESTGGGKFDDANALETYYTPTDAETLAGEAIVNFVTTTNLPEPCNSITTPVTIKITPPNTITSNLALTVCSGNPFSYTITATLPNSSFEWEVDPTATSANASGYSLSGNSYLINGTITNKDPNGGIVKVTYVLRPVNSGCVGDAKKLVITVVSATPKIDFDMAPTEGCGPVTVKFTNNSPQENGTYEWDFGDGSPVYTGFTPPDHTFQPSSIGVEQTYDVSLKLISDCKTFDPVKKQVKVSPAAPVAILDASKTNNDCAGPITINLVNRSPGNNKQYTYYLLDASKNIIETKGPFTDKTTQTFSVQPEPGSSKQVFVRMTAVDKCGTETTTADQPFTVSPSVLVASMFIDNAQQRVCAGQDVDFVNNSTGDIFSYRIYRKTDNSLLVEIPDVPKGRYTYRFTEAGSFYVVVAPGTASCGLTGQESPQQPIIVEPIPNLSFTASVVDCDNLNYKFTLTGVTSSTYTYSWDFGDGTAASIEQEPTHTYANAGSYTVKLTVQNSLGCGTEVTIPIVVREQLKALFTVLPSTEVSIPNFHFSFRDNSTGNPVAWEWDFGDGSPKSTDRNPEYTYPQTEYGKHIVTLTVTDNKGCTSTQRIEVNISGTPGSLFVPNAFVPTASSTILQTFAAKGLGLKEWHMQIFNKWGQLMWETTQLGPSGEPIDGWDGTFKGVPAPQGSYIWQISATFINGTEWKGMSYNNSPPKRTGVVNLIR